MGIGGLDTEFSEIFRRAFASRVFPPGLVEKLGIQHVKGKQFTLSPDCYRSSTNLSDDDIIFDIVQVSSFTVRLERGKR